MDHHFSQSLIELLRSTLRKIEQSAEVGSEDHSLQELKRSILLTIADMELPRVPRLLVLKLRAAPRQTDLPPDGPKA